MPAPKGNQFWKARAKHGRSKIFSSPNQLWLAACEYFQWVEDNPLKESKLVSFKGKSVIEEVPLMRAMTMEGLTRFLSVNTVYFNHFESALDLEKRQGKGFSKVICEIKEIIRDQKFTGASAGLLNANIIARDLGLADKKELSSDPENPLTILISEISGNTLGPKGD
jgi:hypothetical protein